ncbi:Protein lin-54, partial [Fasciola gigantica]
EYSSENESVHTRGCNCKRSSCVKNYCECYEARIRCTSRCRCQSCFNTESWAALTPPGNQSKPGIRPRSGSSYTSCSTDHFLTTAGCSNTENYNGSVTSGLTTAAIDDGRASASSPSTMTNDLDALSAMLVDPSDSPGLVEDTTTLSVDGRLRSDQPNVKLDMDERVAPTIVSVDSSGASGSSTPPSSTSSVLPSPAVEIRGLTKPVLTSQFIQPPILSAPTSATLMTAAIPPINPMDRIWQAVSQATGHHAPLPLCNPLVGLQLPTGPGTTLVGVNGLAPSSSLPARSPPVQSTTTVLGYPGDAPNLLAAYLVALLSGQSQVALPPTQPTPAYFNTANITSVSPSAILLNCPTAPISPTVLTDDARGINTTNRATNNSASIGAASSIGPNVTHPVPTSEPGVLKNTVPCTLAPAPTSVRLATTTTSAAMRPVLDTAKPEINTIGVISVPVEGSRLNGDDQYTAEELATFERLLQQRCRGAPKANPISTAVSQTDGCYQTPIKTEQLDTVSNLETAPPPTLDRSRKSHLSPVHRLNTEVVHLRRQIFRLTRTVRSQDRSIRALQRTIRQLWMSDSALSR